MLKTPKVGGDVEGEKDEKRGEEFASFGKLGMAALLGNSLVFWKGRGGKTGAMRGVKHDVKRINRIYYLQKRRIRNTKKW